tara:strand:+ start:2518 stop:3360 length:843 start_codon:yes stop_codon:yes gene_type:complete
MLLRFILFFSFINCYSQNKTEVYISKYSDLAIFEMDNYNIPASITLAQAILESGNGESKLAIEAKNHFGIKCHNWDGEKIYADDDLKNECFRKYTTVSQSFRDHSLFLVENKRYSSLFMLSKNDYEGWAKGLKKAGYATNPRYDKLLINLIEKYNLHTLDKNTDSQQKIYFAHSYGLPYLVGSGVYLENNFGTYACEVNTSFYLSESNISYHHKLTYKFYAGGGLGVLYLPTEDKKIYPHLQSELIYKYKSLLLRVGTQFFYGDLQYNIAPLFRITYLSN